MILAEYGGAIFALIAGISVRFSKAVFAITSTLSLGFAIHKGMVTGYGICPPLHVFLIIVLTAVATHVVSVCYKMTTGSGFSSGSSSGLTMLLLFAVFFIGGPWLIYSVAANFTMDVRPACTTMFKSDLSDYSLP